MALDASKIPKVSVQLTPDIEWVDFIVNYYDIFTQGYCGYWLLRIKHYEDRGWLAFEHEGVHPEESLVDEAIAAMAAGKPLPQGFLFVGVDMAVAAWKFGVERFGVDWYDNPSSDAITYDYCMQMALLGEQRYA